MAVADREVNGCAAAVASEIQQRTDWKMMKGARMLVRFIVFLPSAKARGFYGWSSVALLVVSLRLNLATGPFSWRDSLNGRFERHFRLLAGRQAANEVLLGLEAFAHRSQGGAAIEVSQASSLPLCCQAKPRLFRAMTERGSSRIA